MSSSGCPDEYYRNCLNAIKSCKQCSAMHSRSKKLFYKPRETVGELGEHPSIQRRLNKRKTQRQAKETEKRIERSVAKRTLSSGAVLGDGDLSFLDSLRVEVKRRGERKSWNLTWDEYSKGKKQNIDVYAIEITTPTGLEETIYMMNETLLATLLSCAKQQLESK